MNTNPITIDDDLSALGKYKDTIGEILFSSNDVVNLVMPTLDNPNFDAADNFFGGEKLEYYNPETKEIEYITLLGHCFDVPYIKPTITDARALICMETYLNKVDGESIKEVALDLYVYAHKNFIAMPSTESGEYKKRGYAGNRIDMLMSAVEVAIKYRSRDFGIGKIMLKPVSPISSYEPNNDFYGRKMSFICSDFYIKPKNRS